MKKQGKYSPKTMGTSDIWILEILSEFSEQIAKSVHDFWPQDSMEQGWSYVSSSYEELPENEKHYDRNTPVETLRQIMKLGVRIVKDNRFLNWNTFQNTHSEKGFV